VLSAVVWACSWQCEHAGSGLCSDVEARGSLSVGRGESLDSSRYPTHSFCPLQSSEQRRSPRSPTDERNPEHVDGDPARSSACTRIVHRRGTPRPGRHYPASRPSLAGYCPKPPLQTLGSHLPRPFLSGLSFWVSWVSWVFGFFGDEAQAAGVLLG
jgi:hypothetical protein